MSDDKLVNKNISLKIEDINGTNFRKGLLVYLLVSSICSLGFIYNDGKRALINHRLKDNSKNYEEELKIIRNNLNICDNMWSAFVFPWTCGKLIIPHLILYTTR